MIMLQAASASTASSPHRAAPARFQTGTRRVSGFIKNIFTDLLSSIHPSLKKTIAAIAADAKGDGDRQEATVGAWRA
jgi:hypothetical protein